MNSIANSSNYPEVKNHLGTKMTKIGPKVLMSGVHTEKGLKGDKYGLPSIAEQAAYLLLLPLYTLQFSRPL